MTGSRRLAIIGGGMTGHSAALAARHNRYSGEITIVSDEHNLPYDRTPLSKAVLQGKRDPNELGFQPGGDYSSVDITILKGNRATEIDIGAQWIMLSSGARLEFDDLLIATGARPIHLREPGFDLSGVHYLRTIEDAKHIKADIARAGKVVVIGAGFIGSEVAASARLLGKDITLVDMLDSPMRGALHPDIAQVCAAIHQDHGVELCMHSRVVELRGSDRVQQAVLEDGRTIECEIVIVGVGVQPNIELAEAAGLEIDNGIVTDEFCRTSIPNVYAAGDVANWWHPDLNQHIRVEHFDNAGSQGTFVGKVIAGATDEPFAPIPYFWSDQYDTNIQYAGFAPDDCEVIIRGNPENRAITAFYLEHGCICAAVTINQAREFRAARRLVAARAKIDSETLQDSQTDIRKLSREFR
jgi:3-phenylpropionate/trans-cinnamate dioxygenase ferredoxin reductase component